MWTKIAYRQKNTWPTFQTSIESYKLEKSCLLHKRVLIHPLELTYSTKGNCFFTQNWSNSHFPTYPSRLNLKSNHFQSSNPHKNPNSQRIPSIKLKNQQSPILKIQKKNNYTQLPYKTNQNPLKDSIFTPRKHKRKQKSLTPKPSKTTPYSKRTKSNNKITFVVGPFGGVQWNSESSFSRPSSESRSE